MHQRDVEVGVTHLVEQSFMTKLIGRPMDMPRLHTATGQPPAEAVGVVIAADILLVLNDREAPHLTAPLHQRAVEQTTLLQVLDQGGGRFVDLLTARGKCRQQSSVMIPLLGLREELHVTHSAFDEPPCNQTTSPKLAGCVLVESVHFLRRSCLLRDIECLFRG